MRLFIRLKAFFGRLAEEPEEIRRRWAIAFFIFSLPVIFAAWLASFASAIPQGDSGSAGQSQFWLVMADSYSQLSRGFANVREALRAFTGEIERNFKEELTETEEENAGVVPLPSPIGRLPIVK